MWLLLLQIFSKYCSSAAAHSSANVGTWASSNPGGRCYVEIRHWIR